MKVTKYITKLAVIVFCLSGCQESELSKRTRAPERNSGDANGGGVGSSSSLYFNCSSEEASKKQPILQNLGGAARPLCALLSESSAKIAVIQTGDLGCPECLDSIKSIESDISKLTDDSKKQLIHSMIIGQGTSMADSKKAQQAGETRAIWLNDHLGMLKRFLAEQKISWADHPIVFVGVNQIAVLDRSEYSSVDDLIHVARKSFDIELSLTSEEQPKEFSWDGLSNQDSKSWSIRNL